MADLYVYAYCSPHYRCYLHLRNRTFAVINWTVWFVWQRGVELINRKQHARQTGKQQTWQGRLPTVASSSATTRTRQVCNIISCLIVVFGWTRCSTTVRRNMLSRIYYDAVIANQGFADVKWSKAETRENSAHSELLSTMRSYTRISQRVWDVIPK